jgi:propanol-preferring alcohol dehydrogenase
MTVPEDYAYPIPKVFSNAEAAPLLCAGAIGFRALRLCHLSDGDRLGLTGFGASSHLVLPTLLQRYPNCECYVFARDARQREFALSLGAVWAGDTHDRSPELLDAIIDTTPAWTPVVEAMANLRPGGRLVINAIRKQAGDQHALLNLDYGEHLWMEKEIKTVANITHYDIAEFLPVAAEVPLRPHVECYPLERANEALMQLKQGGLRGALVLEVGHA